MRGWVSASKSALVNECDDGLGSPQIAWDCVVSATCASISQCNVGR